MSDLAREHPLMRTAACHATFFLALASFTTTAAALDFPDPARLPSQPALPDPLMTFTGIPVTSSKLWTEVRRPELKALFEHYMYGTAPPAPGKVASTLDREVSSALGGVATRKDLTLTFGPPGTPPIRLMLLVPHHRKGPVPLFLGLNFYGNHTVLNAPDIPLPTAWVPEKTAGAQNNRATDAGRGFQADAWSAETVIGRGYALATFYCGDVAPDHPGHTDGVHPHYPGYDWGTVAAWAWGLSRAVDYLVTDPDIDRTRIAVVGHSRLGKAALLAGAFDPRLALVIPHQAGCGGSAPSRSTVGESVERINTVFPHWFNAVFKEFNKHPDRLPFDQHDLVALAAPRPVLFTNAEEDTWANPEGQFEVLRAATPVYRLLGLKGLEADRMPPSRKLLGSTLGYAIRPGAHSMRPEDWTFFLDFADKQLAHDRSTKGQESLPGQ
ncbi:MAG: acetylxylan esterase [Isosphaeraceae bacterium]